MENSIKNERSSIEEDIKIALDKFSDNKDIDSAILIVEKFILGNYILRGGRKNIVKDSLRYILSDYKRVLKENEELEEINNELEAEKNEAIRRYNFETIPIKKVKDKIEELNDATNAEKLEDIMNRKNYTITELVQYVLQELLESEE